MPNTAKIGAATLKRIRDYAVEEPSFTVPFLIWELGVARGTADIAVRELLRLGIVKEIEPQAGIYAAVYAYDPPTVENGRRARLPLPDLDAGIGIGSQAPRRGDPIAHVTPIGPSGRPGRDRKVQERGVRIKRQRQGT
jgi:hypothetical protein